VSDPKKEEVKVIVPSSFEYNTNLANICEFELDIDHAQWLAMCQLAWDKGVRVGMVVGTVFEQFLQNVGYLDPSREDGQRTKVAVTIKDLRGGSVSQFGKNRLLKNKEEESDIDGEEIFGDL